MNPKPFANAMVDALRHANVAKTKFLKDMFNLFQLHKNVVIGAYGNKETDTIAYMEAGISKDNIYIVNPKGELRNIYDSTVTSYHAHALLVDEMYPKVNQI